MLKERLEVLDLARKQLLIAKLSKLITWAPPPIVRTVGPFDPQVFERFDEKRWELIAECIIKVTNLSDEEVEIVTARRTEERGVFRDWRQFKSDEIIQLEEAIPPWYAGGFGDPEKAADFTYWSKMPSFRVAEILCLSVGVDPKFFDADDIETLRNLPRDNIRPPVQFLRRQFELLERQFDPHHHNYEVSPEYFIVWAERVDFEVHPGFLCQLKAYHTRGAEQTVTPNRATTDMREIDTIAMLVTVMAINWLKYEPGAKRSPVPGQIADLAAGLGLRITDDTVRKYRRRGASFLPDDYGRG